MDLRLALYELTERGRLDASASRRLHTLAGLDEAPAGMAQAAPLGVAMLAAALGGLGIIFWIAANWESLGRGARFGLLEGAVLIAGLGALARPAARAPFALVSLLAIGGLLAYFGQTYQTGADPWQLFALWALLALPLCAGVRSDLLWAPWALVAMSAVSLWVHAHAGHRWRIEPDDLAAHAAGWAAAAALITMLSPWARRATGAGAWSLRVAVTLTVVMVSATALGALFHSPVAPHYALALGLLGIAAVAWALPRSFDVYALSAVALGVDTLLVAGLARWLLHAGHGDEIGELLVIGLVAAGLLAGTVSAILRLSRRGTPAQELT
ncbi:MAG: DUF2157 domain-containing protein [Rhizobacter sp.]